MENKIFLYEKDKALLHATTFFVKSCGFQPGKKRHERMMREAEEILQQEKPDFQMKVICSEFGGNAYRQGKVVAKGQEIACNGFSRLEQEHVQNVYLCMITAGDWNMTERDKGSTAAHFGARGQVYMDTWGTAFVDSAKTLLEEELEKNLQEGQFLSDPFGPGYYGMPAQDTKKFALLLDAGRIGVKVRDSGIMIPLKTMAAIYLVTDSKSALPPLSCSQCFGRLGGCHLCGKGQDSKETE